MLVCPSCNNQQTEGKFCGSCGTTLQPLGEVNQSEGEGTGSVQQVSINEQTPVMEAQASTNQGAAATEAQAPPATEAIKDTVNNYWQYFVGLFKNSSKALQLNESNFVNGLITIGLYVVLFAISLYYWLDQVLVTFLDFVSEFIPGMAFFSLSDIPALSLPFMKTVIPFIIAGIVLFAVSAGSILLMLKIGKSKESFKLIVTQYGALAVPYVAINLVAVLGGLIGSTVLNFVPLLLSVILTFSVIPVIFVYEKLHHATEKGLRIHLSLGIVAVIGLAQYILIRTGIANYIERLVTSLLW